MSAYRLGRRLLALLRELEERAHHTQAGREALAWWTVRTKGM